MNRSYDIKDLKSLSPDLINELYEVISTMKTIVDNPMSQQISIWSVKDKCCPYCGSENYKKNGHRKSGSQKFMCKDCGRSFSMTTNTVGSGTHYNIEKWSKFIECELNGLSHRKTAAIVGIHRNTALLWRHKFYDALYYLQDRALKGNIEVDAKNIPINFKGQNTKKMPRNAKRRRSPHSKSKNRHTACIISAVDGEDRMVLKTLGSGKETNDMYKRLGDQIEEGSTIITDGIRGIERICRCISCKSRIVKSNNHVNDEGFSLSSINQIHSELETFMKRYHGVSTRHLQGYLNMFVLRKKLNYQLEWLYHKREAWVSGIPKPTVINKRNEYCIPYPFDMNEVYADYLPTPYT